MGLSDLFKKPAEYLSVTYDEDDGEAMTHGPWNDYECDDPSCCCHDAEESDDGIPVPWQALQDQQDRKKR